MKNKFYVRMLLGAVVLGAMMGCKEDKPENDLEPGTFDGRTITATVVNGNAYNGVVSKVVADAWIGGENGKYEEIASGSYANGGFTMTLPATLDAKFLEPIGRFFGSINISNKDVKGLVLDIFSALDSKGEEVDDLYYVSADNNSYTYIFFMYVDGDVSINGSYEREEDGFSSTCSVSLKKGWNMVYIRRSATNGEMTTKPVSGAKWYFEKDPKGDDNGSAIGEFNITATVENGNAYNSIVSEVAVRPLASGSYANGGFTLTLPAIQNPMFLEPLWERFYDNRALNISDWNAETYWLASRSFVVAYDRNGEIVDNLYYCKLDSSNNSVTIVSFIYTDRNVSISGSYEDEGYAGTYNMSLKKGWNMMYTAYDFTLETTTTSVSGIKWYFSRDLFGPDYSSPLSAMAKSSMKSIKSGGGKTPKLFNRPMKR